MNLTIFLSSYLLIIGSLIGYGLKIQSWFNKSYYLEFGFSLLGATLFWIVLSFFTHFFFSHNYTHNIIILVIGLILFLLEIIKGNKSIKENYKYLLFIFIILIFGLLIAKTHDDFPYYHFPYIYYLTQENLIIGSGILNHGFRTPSSIFYLNSIFYLPIIKYYSFSIGATLLFGISNLILILKLKKDYNNKKFDYIFFLTLLSFLFLNIFFYRIAEHGTDRSAQMLIFILFIEILSLTRDRINLKNFFSKIFILLGLIISLKAFYVLYLLVLIPVIFYIKNEKLTNFYKDIFKNIYFYFLIFTGFFLILVNIFNTGCVIYPVQFTCLTNFDWSLHDQAKQMSDWYEQWAKAGAGPNFRVDDPENYIKNFNWVSNWIDKYFFNKVSDFLLSIVFLLIVILLTFYSKNNKKIIKDYKMYGVYFVILILFIEWFLNHPSLRYGGYSLIALLFFIPTSIYISGFVFKKDIKNKIITLIICSLLIFLGRNISRINTEIEKFDYNFLKNPYYMLNENHFRIDNYMKKIKLTYQNCINENLEKCLIDQKIEIRKKNDYFFLIRKND